MSGGVAVPVLTLCVAFAVVLTVAWYTRTVDHVELPSCRPTGQRRFAVPLRPCPRGTRRLDERVGFALAERRYFYSVPVIGRAEWIVVDTEDSGCPPGSAETRICCACASSRESRNRLEGRVDEQENGLPKAGT
jgi:hypothetical protein